ncbi:putative ABC transport system permease protein [Larkinella arboricola]|uniref:Putative ABC transport system permease protein n=1 Tax=Larkinella arboricola TaxID=643671 RepID=A0A327XBT7_LARAB|nr:ABC transporter permease [Larkinella arboricola]RAK03102.1 putative ABC transport system permease protein [Larkinella arboricola]
MIRNYVKIAWRNLVRNRVFSAINIVGLAIGLATCLLISLFVLDELSFDRFHAKSDRIVRVVFRGTVQGGKMNEAHVMPPVARTLQADYPEVQEATRLRHGGMPQFLIGDNLFNEESMAFADSNFFQVFSFPLLQGNPKTALSRPNTVVLTKPTALKMFGRDNALGKTVQVKGSNVPLTVTGVMDEIPANSHFHFDVFTSMASLAESKSPSWMTSEFFTYLVLPKGYDYRQLEAKLPQVVEKYMGPQIETAFGMKYAQFRQKGNDIGLFLQPLTAIHLHSDSPYDLEPAGNIQYVYLFSAVALFVLLIASINFMNLSTAGASKRAKEVGIRKVMGSLRLELTFQFLIESLLLTAIALGVALALVYAALPLFNSLSGKTLTFSFVDAPWLLPGLLLFGVFVGVLAGSYPAFFLASFKPVAVLKGRFTFGKSTISLRSGLVVFQFFIAILLMVGTTVVYRQLDYIQNKKLGYDKDQVLVLSNTWALGPKEEIFRDLLLQDPRVVNVSHSGYLPAGPSNNNNFFVYPDNHSTQLVKTLRYDVDYNYIPTLGMEVVAGRNFSKSFGTDSTGVILNEAAAKAFGWKANAIGRTITRPDREGTKATYQVVGVVKDFHFRSLHERITPLVMVLAKAPGTMIVKVKTREVSGLLASIKKRWSDFGADQPFSYSFLDERFMKTYESEQRIGQILRIFSGLTIFVACLGLLGLATFTAEQRTKEIGVRKVLGASVGSIVGLLSKEFVKLVLIALVLASPVAWYAMDKWLQAFEYKIAVSWWMFALAGVLAIAVALLTISFQSIKAALINPVHSLRGE